MLFILLLALILFGPKRLPEIARQVGKFVAEFKRASNDFKYQLQAEIDKADTPKGAQQNSPAIPTLDPSTPKTGALGTPALPPAETLPASPTSPQMPEGARAADPDSEHERLMRTARMAYEAQAFTLRPPEPPPVAHTTRPPVPEQSSPAEPPSVPSTGNSAPAGDSHPQSAQGGQLGAAQQS